MDFYYSNPGTDIFQVAFTGSVPCNWVILKEDIQRYKCKDTQVLRLVLVHI